MLDNIIMFGSALLAVAVIVYILIKKMDIKIALFLMDIVLLLISRAAGNALVLDDSESSVSALLDPLQLIVHQFKATITLAGLIILFLGVHTAYKSHIGPNDLTVQMLPKLINKIKSVYIV